MIYNRQQLTNLLLPMIDCSRSHEEIVENFLKVIDQDREAQRNEFISLLDNKKGKRVHYDDVFVDFRTRKDDHQNELMDELREKVGALYA